MAIDYFQQQFGEDVYEDDEPKSAAPAAPSDEQILAFVQANIDNPALIAETAAQYGVSIADLSRATGFGSDAVVSYFEQHDVAPPTYTPPAVETEKPEPPPPPPPPDIVEPPRPPDIVEPPPPPPPPPDEPIYEPPPPPEEPIYEPPPPPPPPPPPEKPVVEPPRFPEEPVYEPPPEVIYEPKIVDLGDGTFRTPGGNIIDSNGYPVTKAAETTTSTTTAADATTATPTTTATTAATTTATTLPAVTDHQGNQFDGTQLLTLARQIAENAGTMTGGAFQTKGANIGFAASEANTLLGRTATASEQVLLDMARQMIQSGVTDLSQLKTQDITSSGISVQLDPETNQYYALIPSADGETSTRKDLTADQVAKIKTEEIMGSGGEGGSDAYTRRTIDDLVTGKGLFANGKLLTAQDAVDNPIAYTIGATYTGGGGTSYDLKFDPKTGKSVVSATGFTTSDADTIMPIIMIASNFLLPGVGSFLTSSLVEAGMSEFVSQIVSKSVINGVTSGIMAEASGGDFGDGFLKGSITGAISAGVAPMISTALPSDLSPAMSTALTKAGTAAITALATGKDVGTAIGTQLLNSTVGTGLGAISGEIGLTGADAKLLTSVLTPVVTQLVTNGNVNDATLMNAVLLAGSTILANTGSNTVNNVSTLTTGSDADTTVGGLNLLANTTGNETLTDLASTLNTGLGAVSTATGLLNKATSLTKPVTKVNKTRANLTGALRTNTPTTRTATVKPAALGALNTAKKTLTAQQMSQMKASKPPARVNVANLTPIKTTSTPKKVDVSTLKPLTNVSGLAALKQTPTGKG